MADEGSGLRERKKARRRTALIDAAQELALARGISEVTIDAICEEADVSRRTFFNYFATKEDAILATGSVELPATAAEVFTRGGPSGDLLTDIGHLVEAVQEGMGEDRPRVARARQILEQDPALMVRHAALMEQHRTRVLALAEERLGAGDHRTQVVAVLFMATAMLTALRAGEEAPLGGVTAQAGTSPTGGVAGVIADLRSVLDG